MSDVDVDRAARFRIITQRLGMEPKRPSGTAWYNAYKLDVHFLLGEIADQQAATNDGEREGAGR